MEYGFFAVAATGIPCSSAYRISSARPGNFSLNQGVATARLPEYLASRRRSEFEAHLIIAFAGGTMGNRVRAFRPGDFNHSLRD